MRSGRYTPLAMSTPIRAAAQALADTLSAWRRHLHAHPELSGQEAETARYVAAELRRLGYQPREQIADTHGLIADLLPDSPSGAAAVALRADMDALPITEETGATYASRRPGVMHACGHDAHMAMLLGAAALLAERRAELRAPVRLIFQPSEEKSPGGAAPLVAAGVLNGVGEVYGLHIWSEMPVGTLGTRVGPFMSATSELRITITGRGGHAAMPQQCVDPIVVAAELVLALQTIVSRSIAMTDSAVVSITQVQGGSASNIIPEMVELRGTVRTLSEPVRAIVCARVHELATGVARNHGAAAEVAIREGYPAVVNDANAVSRALAAARAIGIGETDIVTMSPQGGGEDFAYYAQKVPAAFLFLGGRNETKGCCHPHHHPRFDIDEAALPIGAALLTQVALDWSVTGKTPR